LWSLSFRVQAQNAWKVVRDLNLKSRLTQGPTQPPTQWVLGLLTKGVKRLKHEADHSPHTDVKDVWSYTSSYPHISMAWYLVKPRDNFTFTFNKNEIVYRLINLIINRKLYSDL
jgi:hypothetical protein